jgi:hypothetical protein
MTSLFLNMLHGSMGAGYLKHVRNLKPGTAKLLNSKPSREADNATQKSAN